MLSCLEAGKALVVEGNREKEKITTKLEEIQQLWDDLKELSHARQEVRIPFFRMVLPTFMRITCCGFEHVLIL